jgi:protease I
MLNAGAIWVDEPVVADGNLVSSRTPADLAAFAKRIVEWLKRGDAVAAAGA